MAEVNKTDSVTVVRKHDSRDIATIGDRVAGGGLEWHNFDGDKLQQWRLKALAQSTAERGAKSKGEVFRVKYWYVQTIQVLDDDTNEYSDSVRVVLMAPDESCISFVSGGVVKSLMGLVEVMGNGPYDPPIEVRLHEAETRKGRRVYSLIPVIA